jgi:hypothetical protein
MATPQDKLYFAVRKSDRKEWIDVNTWGYVIQSAKSKVKETDENIPHWAKDNPVVRYAQFQLKEV